MGAEDALAGIKEAVRAARGSYDVNEHIEQWAAHREERGIPYTREVLVAEAAAVGERLAELERAASAWTLG